jgi:tetratricopeptide (TPR) repeat protein
MWRCLIFAVAAVCAGAVRGDREFLEGRYLDALASYQAELRATAGAGERAHVLGNLALLYVQLGEYDRALASYREVLGGVELAGLERGRVLSGLGDLYRRMGQAPQAREAYLKAREAYRAAGARAEEIHALESAGAFAEAVQLAEAGGDRTEAARAHLFSGEWKLRAGDLAAAGREFAAAGTNWRAIFGAARVARQRGERDRALALARQAVAVLDAARPGPGPQESDFLPDARAVYDAALGMLLEGADRDAAEWFGLMERAHACGLRDLVRGEGAPPLDAVRRRLGPGAGLVECWTAEGRPAAVWVTREGAGVASAADGIPWEKMRRVWVVPDGAMWRTAFEARLVGGGRLIERAAVSYLPAAALLFRERERRGALAPWRTQMAKFGHGAQVKARVEESAAAGVPLLHFAAPAVEDAADGNRSRIVFAPGNEGADCLFRG